MVCLCVLHNRYPNQAIIARHLKNRFKSNIIYTYVGDILVSINPFKQLGLYEDEVCVCVCVCVCVRV